MDRSGSLTLCTGDGICCEIAPDIFELHNDGLAYVKDVPMKNIYDGSSDPKEPKYQMATGLAAVPDNLLDDVIESADECPGECIYISLEE